MSIRGLLVLVCNYAAHINLVTSSRYRQKKNYDLYFFLQPFDFPRSATLKRYSIGYVREGFSFEIRRYPSFTLNTFQIRNLQFLSSYNFTVRAEVQFPSCFRTVVGVPSDPVTAVPMEARKS